MTRFDTLLEPAVQAAIQAVLGGRVEALQSMPAWPDTAVAAAVGFSGPMVVGSLGLSSGFGGLGATHPLRGQTPLGESALMDWAGELANQLFGGVKRELASHGVVAWPSTPVVMRGVQLRVQPSTAGAVRSYRVVGTNTVVWLEFHAPQRLDFEVDSSVGVESAGAGEVLLF